MSPERNLDHCIIPAERRLNDDEMGRVPSRYMNGPALERQKRILGDNFQEPKEIVLKTPFGTIVKRII